MAVFDVHIKVETTPQDTDLMGPNGGFVNSLRDFYRPTAVNIGEINIKEEPAKITAKTNKTGGGSKQ